MADKLPKTPWTVVRIVWDGDRENTESLYFSTDKTDYWHHMGAGLGSVDWLIEQRAKSIEFVTRLPAPVKRTPDSARGIFPFDHVKNAEQKTAN